MQCALYKTRESLTLWLDNLLARAGEMKAYKCHNTGRELVHSMNTWSVTDCCSLPPLVTSQCNREPWRKKSATVTGEKKKGREEKKNKWKCIMRKRKCVKYDSLALLWWSYLLSSSYLLGKLRGGRNFVLSCANVCALNPFASHLFWFLVHPVLECEAR